MASFLKRALGALLALALVAATILFVSLMLALALAAALVFGGVLWWQSRGKPGVAARPAQGVVIEGEYRVEREDARLERRAL